MINIDNTQQLLDSQGGDVVITSIHKFPDQIASSLSDIIKLDLPTNYSSIKNIVYCGMGGSRFPGLILYQLYKSSIKVPFEFCDDYILPGSVNQDTLVVLSSYSGTTEEVLYTAQLAKDKSAKIIGFSVGGPLRDWLENNHYPHYTFDQQFNPSGQPRMGFGYTMGSMLGILIKLNLLNFQTNQVDFVNEINKDIANLKTISKSYDVDVSIQNNLAKQMATSMKDHYPYLIVSEHLVGVGNCFQNQINETSKNISSYRVIPELNHHLMEGLQFPQDHATMALFVTFYSSLYHERIQKRFSITEGVVKQNNINVIRHNLVSETMFGQVLELSVFGSYVTMYLAGLYGVDPSKVPYVDYFKAQLKK